LSEHQRHTAQALMLMPKSSDIQNSSEAFRLKTRNIKFDISVLIPLRLKILPHVSLATLSRIYNQNRLRIHVRLDQRVSADRWRNKY